MATLGWGTGGWGNFGWGGVVSGETYYYDGYVTIGLDNSAQANFELGYVGHLPISSLSAYRLSLVPYLENCSVEFVNSINLVPAYSGRLSIVLDNSHSFVCDCNIDGSLAVKLANRGGIALDPGSSLELTLTNDGLVAVKPYIEGQAVTLANSYSLLREDSPSTKLAISLVNGVIVVAECKPETKARIVFVPSSKVYGWQCPDDKKSPDYETQSKNATSWNNVTNRIAQYDSASKNSATWDNVNKKEPIYHGG